MKMYMISWLIVNKTEQDEIKLKHLTGGIVSKYLLTSILVRGNKKVGIIHLLL